MLYGYQTWSEELLMQAEDEDDDLNGDQKSTGVKYMYSKLCSSPYGNQTWSEESLMQVQDDDDLHGGQLRHVLKPTQIKSVTIITISGIIVFTEVIATCYLPP